MFVVTMVLVLLLAFVMGGGAVGKLVGVRSQLETAAKLRIPWSRYRVIAVPEASAALGLLIGLALPPLGVAAATGVVLLMTGALLFRVRVHDTPGFLVGDATLLVLAGITGAFLLAI